MNNWNKGWGQNAFSWNNYSGYFSTYEDRHKLVEKKRKFKNKMREKALDELTPVTVRVNNQPTTFMKRRILTVNIDEKDLDKYNTDEQIEKIVGAYEKIPYNSDIIDNEMLKSYLGQRNRLEDFSAGAGGRTLANHVKEYYNGKMTYDNLRTHFVQPSPQECKLFADSGGGYAGFGTVGTRVNLNKRKYEKDLKIIRSKIKTRDIVSKDESLRKGKRINRNFINKTSYKPLMEKNIEEPRKKKLFIIQDCSGSMGSGTSIKNPAYKATSFAAACVNSGVFEIDHVIFHSNSGWQNVAPEMKKGELFNLAGGSEGFEVIDDNLDKAYLAGVDYVVVLTDLCIGSDAQEGLYEYIKGKKHLILSFEKKGTLKGLNVRQIKGNADMINSLVTLAS